MTMGQKAMSGTVVAGRDSKGRVRQEICIQQLLEWAFADECASVDFEDAGTLSAGYGYTSNAYRVHQRGMLGCRVDGGGRSLPDADADLVAAAVAVLPEGCGGRGMALQIAELARTRRVPDAMVGARARCVPVATRRNMHGTWGVTELLCQVTDLSGRKAKRVDVRWCPVTYSNLAHQLHRARRNYLQWCLALLELRQTFKIYDNLSRWVLSDRMPPMRPWQEKV
ncbi:hypothetical protein [uncultured Sulfitobacter sp.]|uniref:hypothetical protein n=1 Tax=uncultured Sulfitobacter sp. TaxID=191468 RepID=UPI002623BB26|nr:hypothetical protein [uncultured Sulfitobacter sp.]